jgi:hypothetical protein
MMKPVLNCSCVAAVMDIGGRRFQKTLVAFSGGDVMDEEGIILWNIWAEEVENSDDIEDIFCTYDEPPNKKGFYVWEGEITPVYDDQPRYNGAWRPATKEDMANLVP